MSSYREQVSQLVLGSLWSMWAEFGVSGWDRYHQDSALDLEALILTTARLGHRDARLRSEALDWCVAHGRIASVVRIKRLLASADQPTRDSFGWFAATVNAHTHLRWPGATSPQAFTRTGRSSAPVMTRPALLQLRLRALWGVSARAEVLRVMLTEGERFMGVSEVAAAAAYGKDAVADALDSLHRGGLLEGTGMRNQHVFRLHRREQFTDLLETLPDPEHSQPWQDILPLMAGFMEAADLAGTPSMARAAEIQRRWREWQPTLARLGAATPHPGTGGDFLRGYERITLGALERWSGRMSSRANPSLAGNS